MFDKVLVANRGEIALRVIRACKELGIKTVAVYSDVDKESLPVAFADESVCIGPYNANLSYLNIKNIISAAEIANVDAIHPGYGFLAENRYFLKICEDCGFKFIGPKAEHLELMGHKSMAKETMKKLNVPTVPGSVGSVADITEALNICAEIGFPVMIKAAEGGGGKGLRVATDQKSFINNFNMAKLESKKAFGSDEVYIEKYIENPRHIEVQVFGDSYGNAIHLFERECSIQRKHQKVLEEAPSIFIDDKLRSRMGEASTRVVKELGYENAGTIEYLVDSQGNFYFMEMNTRIQVEHPVTEMITGVDLVKLQIEVASGKSLGYTQQDIKINGHAIECRINAENSHTFMPSPGEIKGFYTPGGFGVRIDSICYQNYVVSPFYDSMVAKLIVHDIDRTKAISKMKRSLDEFIIEGIDTTIPLHKAILETDAFIKGDINTGFIERYINL